MKKATKLAFGSLLCTLVGFFASFLIPPPVSWSGDMDAFHWTLANSVLYTLLHIGAAILFLTGLRAYKAALRAAYLRIAIGVVLAGVGLAQVVSLNIFGLIETPWVQYGGVMLPFVIGGLAIYSGVRSMAKLVGVTSILTKVAFIAPLIIAGIIVTSLLPHGSLSLTEVSFDVSNAIGVWDVVLYTASLGLVLQIKNHSGAHYTQSMAWLAFGLLGSVLVTSFVLVGTFILGDQPQGYLLDAMVVIGGLLYLKAGQSFAKTEEV